MENCLLLISPLSLFVAFLSLIDTSILLLLLSHSSMSLQEAVIRLRQSPASTEHKSRIQANKDSSSSDSETWTILTESHELDLFLLLRDQFNRTASVTNATALLELQLILHQ